MATNSETPANAQDNEQSAKVNSVLRHTFFNNAVRDLTIQAEVQAFQLLFEGATDQRAAQAARLIGKTQGLVGVGEFLLNPIVGRFSDAFGRRIFTLLGCSWGCIGNLIVAQNPAACIGPLPVLALNRLIQNTSLTLAGSVTSNVAMSDLLKGKDLAIALGRMNASFGLGSIVGPAIGARLLAKTGSIRICYIARAALAALHALHNCFMMRETLNAKDRRKLTLKGLNPFGFVKLLGEGSVLLRMVAIQTLVSMSEAKNLIDLKTMWLKQNLKLGIDKVSLEQTLYGFMMLLSGTYVAPAVIRNFGQKAFTSIALTTSATAFLLWAKSKVALMWIGLALLLPGINATSSFVIKARAIDAAAEQGMGKGEFGSYIANLRALTVVASPVLYGEIYARFMTRHGGQGNLTWIFVACITSILPEILHRSLPAHLFHDKQ